MKPAHSGEAGGERGMQSHRPERIVFEAQGFFAMRHVSYNPHPYSPQSPRQARDLRQGVGIAVFPDEQHLTILIAHHSKSPAVGSVAGGGS